MKGPEIRLRDFKDGSVILKDGDMFTLTSEDAVGDEKKASITYLNLPKDIKDVVERELQELIKMIEEKQGPFNYECIDSYLIKYFKMTMIKE